MYYFGNLAFANGVKQAGVMSPLLFSIYVDGLLKTLKAVILAESFLVGASGYADDLQLTVL